VLEKPVRNAATLGPQMGNTDQNLTNSFNKHRLRQTASHMCTISWDTSV